MLAAERSMSWVKCLPIKSTMIHRFSMVLNLLKVIMCQLEVTCKIVHVLKIRVPCLFGSTQEDYSDSVPSCHSVTHCASVQWMVLILLHPVLMKIPSH